MPALQSLLEQAELTLYSTLSDYEITAFIVLYFLYPICYSCYVDAYPACHSTRPSVAIIVYTCKALISARDFRSGLPAWM